MAMEYKKGHKKAGGRKPGTPNKATESIKNLLNCLLPEERLAREWNYYLKHADPHIRFEAFKPACMNAPCLKRATVDTSKPW